MIQAFAICAIHDSVKRFSLGNYTAVSSIALLAVLLYQDVQIRNFNTPIQIGLRIPQLVFATLLAFASISMSRRPDVFHDGRLVDRMYTQSAFNKYSFTWVEHLLTLARKKNRLEQEDLPIMDHYTRSKEATDAWIQKTHTRKLWIEIFLAHKSAVMLQWLLTLFQAFGNLAPQFVTFKLLKLLEKQSPNEPVGPEAWFWVVALTVVCAGAASNESWLYWISWAELAIPIRAELAALIFQKGMRRKDVKGASKSDKKENKTTSLDDATPAGGSDDNTTTAEDTQPKGKQSTINLIAVDAKRVADFVSFNNYFPGR